MRLRKRGVSLRNTRGCKNRTLIDVVCLSVFCKLGSDVYTVRQCGLSLSVSLSSAGDSD